MTADLDRDRDALVQAVPLNQRPSFIDILHFAQDAYAERDAARIEAADLRMRSAEAIVVLNSWDWDDDTARRVRAALEASA
jgi:hypothetical protein